MGDREQNESEEAAGDMPYKQVKTIRVELLLIFFFPLLTTTLVLVNGLFVILMGHHQGMSMYCTYMTPFLCFDNTCMR